MDSDLGMDANEGTAQGDWLLGGKGDDTLYGSSKADILTGGAGNDQIRAGGGDDIILGDAHISPLRKYVSLGIEAKTREWTWDYNLGNYEDKVTDGFAMYIGRAFLWESSFTESDYTLTTFDGLSDNKRVDDNGGNDELHGGAGNDFIAGQTGSDILYGDAGDDVMYGDDAQALPAGSQDGNDEMYAGSGKDILFGGAGDDTLDAHEADGEQDTLHGGADNDVLRAGTGGDMLYGEAGDDTLWAGSEGGTLDGGADNDYYIGGAGNDTLTDEAGDETYVLTGGGNDTVNDSTGNDTYLIFSAALQTGGNLTINDSDGQGAVYFDGTRIDANQFTKIDATHWQSNDSRYTLTLGGGGLMIHAQSAASAGYALLQGFNNGDFGIDLTAVVTPPPAPTNHAPTVLIFSQQWKREDNAANDMSWQYAA